MTSRRFNERTGDAKRAAIVGPVYMTDRGRPSHVLMSYDHYMKLVEDGRPSLVEMLCRTLGVGEADLEIPSRGDRARTVRGPSLTPTVPNP